MAPPDNGEFIQFHSILCFACIRPKIGKGELKEKWIADL